MFQAEYSSGQPLRMLVDLRASVDFALGRGAEAEGGEKAAEATAAAKAAPAKAAPGKAAPLKPALAKPASAKPGASQPALNKPAARGAAAGTHPTAPEEASLPAAAQAKFSLTPDQAPEFAVSASAPEWNPEEDSEPGKKK
jgi:hypothetical protein